MEETSIKPQATIEARHELIPKAGYLYMQRVLID